MKETTFHIVPAFSTCAQELILQVGKLWTTRIVKDGEKIQIKAIATFYVIFGSLTNILFIVEVKFLMLIKWSYSPPPPLIYVPCTLNLECTKWPSRETKFGMFLHSNKYEMNIVMDDIDWDEKSLGKWQYLQRCRSLMPNFFANKDK